MADGFKLANHLRLWNHALHFACTPPSFHTAVLLHQPGYSIALQIDFFAASELQLPAAKEDNLDTSFSFKNIVQKIMKVAQSLNYHFCRKHRLFSDCCEILRLRFDSFCPQILYSIFSLCFEALLRLAMALNPLVALKNHHFLNMNFHFLHQNLIR